MIGAAGARRFAAGERAGARPRRPTVAAARPASGEPPAGAAASTRPRSGRRCAPPACAPATPCRRTSSPTSDVLDAILAEADPAPGRPGPRDRPGPRAADRRRCSTPGPRSRPSSWTAAWPRSCASASPSRSRPGQLTLIEGDALDQDLVRLVPPPYDVVANLPYHITSPILHRLLGEPPRPGRLVLMVQREVAERIAAPPGKMSYLSVFVQYHARVRVAFARAARRRSSRSRRSTRRSSSSSRSTPTTGSPLDDEDALWRLVQAGFRERRKMLHNVLVAAAPGRRRRASTPPSPRPDIAPDRRPQTLAVGEWLALLEALGPIGTDQRGRRAGRADDDRATPAARARSSASPRPSST